MKNVNPNGPCLTRTETKDREAKEFKTPARTLSAPPAGKVKSRKGGGCAFRDRPGPPRTVTAATATEGVVPKPEVTERRLFGSEGRWSWSVEGGCGGGRGSAADGGASSEDFLTFGLSRSSPQGKRLPQPTAAPFAGQSPAGALWGFVIRSSAVKSVGAWPVSGMISGDDAPK